MPALGAEGGSVASEDVMPRWDSALRGVHPADMDQAAPHASEQEKQGTAAEDDLAAHARARAPVVWLLGKVQSGKTSIIRAITGSTTAEIGDGFRPCTRTARVYEFPSDIPVLRFLDTRGLGEVSYDPAEDLAVSEVSAHLVLAAMRATDPGQEAVVAVLREVRARHPDWPIVVAQTSLHDAYPPGRGHVLPYPFEAGAPPEAVDAIPIDLMRSLAYQRTLLDRLPGDGLVRFVPIDLTRPEDGLEPVDYGLDALMEALAAAAPAGMLAVLDAMPGFAADSKAKAAGPIVMGHAMAAAGSDLVPVPMAGAIAVTTIQARMLSKLGSLYGIAWDRRAYAELGAALGAGTLARLASGIGLRQLAKLIPVYGQTAGAAASAAASFAITYALGKAAAYYLHGRRLGTHDRSGISKVYRDSLREAFRIARERRLGGADGEAKP